MAQEKGPVITTSRKRAPRKTARPRGSEITSARFVDLGQRAALIAEAAFFLAERRGFEPGHEIEDWLAAEARVDAELLQAAESGPQDQRRA